MKSGMHWDPLGFGGNPRARCFVFQHILGSFSDFQFFAQLDSGPRGTRGARGLSKLRRFIRL